MGCFLFLQPAGILGSVSSQVSAQFYFLTLAFAEVTTVCIAWQSPVVWAVLVLRHKLFTLFQGISVWLGSAFKIQPVLRPGQRWLSSRPSQVFPRCACSFPVSQRCVESWSRLSMVLSFLGSSHKFLANLHLTPTGPHSQAYKPVSFPICFILNW